MIVRYLIFASALALASCGSEQPTERRLHDSVNGVDLLVQHLTGPALSQSEDKVFVVRDGEKEVIFEGYGSPSLGLRSVEKGVLIISYCGGSIRSTSAFLSDNSASGEVMAIKVQPIIASGIQIDGRTVCAAE